MRRFFPRLRSDESGVTLVEFALIAPTVILMLMGLFDISYNMYSSTILRGAIQEAARDSTIEGASETSIDGAVRAAILDVANNATVTFDRRAYSNFTDVSRPETFQDANGDGTCNDGELFDDINDNGTWDQDQGVSGQGGARDAVLYTVTVEYPRAFPLANLIGISETNTTQAITVLRNQPFDESEVRDKTGNCI